MLDGNLKKPSLFWFSVLEYTIKAGDAMSIYKGSVGGR